MSAATADLRRRWMTAIRKVVSDLEAVADTKDAAELREKINQLKDVCSKSADACMAALTQCGGDFEAALELLLSQPESESSTVANRASSSSVETKTDELYPSMDSTARIATIKLPPHVRPGEKTIVTAPDGNQYRIEVPADKRGGDEIKMRY